MNEEIKLLEAEALKLQAKMRGMVDPLQQQIDEIDLKLQKQGFSATNSPVYDQVMRVVKSANWITSFKDSKRGGTLDFKGMDLMTKAAGTVTTVTDTIPPQFTNFQYVPGRRVHVRDLLPSGLATSSTIWMPYESAITNSTARVAEGALKPLSDFTPAVVKWDIEKIATTVKFTQEMLEDFPQFTSYITTRWIELLKQCEDEKLIYGSGISDIKGLATTAAAYVDVLADSAVDRWMVLDAAATQVQTSGFTPNYILVHPTTAMQIRQTRESTHGYLVDPSKPMIVNGATIIPHPAMIAGDFLVGDYTAGAMLWDRKSANITFFDQNEDDAKKNLILAVIEERLALVTYQSTAFVFSDFTSALAKGSA